MEKREGLSDPETRARVNCGDLNRQSRAVILRARRTLRAQYIADRALAGRPGHLPVADSPARNDTGQVADHGSCLVVDADRLQDLLRARLQDQGYDCADGIEYELPAPQRAPGAQAIGSAEWGGSGGRKG